MVLSSHHDQKVSESVASGMISARRMVRYCSALLLALTLAVAALIAVTSYAHADDRVVVRVTTKLGVEASVPVGSLGLDSDALFHDGFVLSLAKDMEVTLPIELVRSGKLHQGITALTLVDGKVLNGKLLSSLRSADDSQAQYDLSTVPSFTVSLPQGAPAPLAGAATANESLWQLHVVKPMDATYVVRNPRFTWRVSAFRGTWTEAWTETGITFWVKLGNENVQGNLTDFDQIAFKVLVDKKGMKTAQITTKSATGKKNTGPFTRIVENAHKNDYSPSGSLAVDLTEIPGATLVLDPEECTLTRATK